MKEVKQRIVTDITILERELKQYGVEGKRATKCPFCPSHDALYIKVNNNTFKCFSCGEQGNVIDLVMRKEGLSFTNALKDVANRYGIQLPNKEFTPAEKAKYAKIKQLENRRDKQLVTLNNLLKAALFKKEMDIAFEIYCEIEEAKEFDICKYVSKKMFNEALKSNNLDEAFNIYCNLYNVKTFDINNYVGGLN